MRDLFLTSSANLLSAAVLECVNRARVEKEIAHVQRSALVVGQFRSAHPRSHLLVEEVLECSFLDFEGFSSLKRLSNVNSISPPSPPIE